MLLKLLYPNCQLSVKFFQGCQDKGTLVFDFLNVLKVAAN